MPATALRFRLSLWINRMAQASERPPLASCLTGRVSWQLLKPRLNEDPRGLRNGRRTSATQRWLQQPVPLADIAQTVSSPAAPLEMPREIPFGNAPH
jgi:hypothetical protein